MFANIILVLHAYVMIIFVTIIIVKGMQPIFCNNLELLLVEGLG